MRRLILLTLLYTLVRSKTPINLLILVPWPDSKEDAGWDVGLDLLPGARVAVQEINNRTDILNDYSINIIEAGHEACGLSIHSFGLINLVDNAVNRLRATKIAAVLGLFCSTSTAALSPIAGHEGADLIQLSASNAPIFEDQFNEFPHLWRFLESASVHADMMIKIMQENNWTRIAIVNSQGSLFYEGIALSLIKKLKEMSKTLLYHGHLLSQAKVEGEVLSHLIEQEARIVFVAAESTQVARLLCTAYNHSDGEMVYPNYLWVLPDQTLDSLISIRMCEESLLSKVLEGSILSQFNLVPFDSAELFQSSSYNYSTYLEHYYREIENVKGDYRNLIIKTGKIVMGNSEYASILYDQVWAFAIALNNSLSEVQAKKILEDYGFGHPKVTQVIEDSLTKLDFRGVSGYVKFDEYRGVSSLLDVRQIVNRTSTLVAERVSFTNYSGRIELNFSASLDDEFDTSETDERVSASVAITMVVCLVSLFLLITAVLLLLIKNRHEHEIKVISLNISLLIFIGCYIIIVILITETVAASVPLSDEVFTILCNFEYILSSNSLTIIFVTLFLKLNRLYKIFFNKELHNLGKLYGNWAIIIQSVVFTLIPNIGLVILLSNDPRQKLTSKTQSTTGSVIVVKHYPYCGAKHSSATPIFNSIYAVFFSLLMVLNVYLASKIAKISNQAYKKTKVVNILNFLIFITYVTLISVNIVFFSPEGAAVLYRTVIGYLFHFFTAFYCQLFLFAPSLYLLYLKKFCR